MARPDTVTGKELESRGLFAEARAHYEQALSIAGDDAALLQDYVRLCIRIGDHAAAVAPLQRLLRLQPTPSAQGLLARLLVRLGRDDEAVPHLKAMLRAHPEDGQGWLQLAAALLKSHDLKAALQCAAEADRLAPAERALDIALECLGTMGMRDEVEQCLADAERRYPDSDMLKAHRGVHLLRQGQIAEGLTLQPYIRARLSPRLPEDMAIAAARWDGKPFAGVLLVSGEQGLGEQILGASFLSLLTPIRQRAVVECDARLVPVFRRSFPSLTFWPAQPGNARRLAADGTTVKRTRMLDLPPLLSGGQAFRQPERWLFADPERTASIRERYERAWPGRTFIGISWRSVREIRGNQWKSLPPQSFLPLVSLPGAVVFDIQYGSHEEERRWPVAQGSPALERDSQIDPLEDLDGLLAQMCALDAVVTVSNSTAHLAGAAGLHADVILPPDPPTNVYWCYEGSRTPMYPSLRLWRPGAFASTNALFDALTQDLHKRIPHLGGGVSVQRE